MEVAVVTGAGRGIGLELTRLLVDSGRTVVACPRTAGGPELAALGPRVHEVALDVADEDSVAAGAAAIARRVEHVDLLFNNAGVYPDEESAGIEQADLVGAARAFEVNALGPLRVVRALLGLLRRGSGKRLVQVTSLMGSIQDNTAGGSYGYRMSKAALNMATRNLALELGPEGFTVVAIHPGWVRTRMGGSDAPLGVTPAAREVLRIALTAGPEQNGAFLGPGGETLPY